MTSPRSSTPSALKSVPDSMRVPPETQLSPAGSSLSSKSAVGLTRWQHRHHRRKLRRQFNQPRQPQRLLRLRYIRCLGGSQSAFFEVTTVAQPEVRLGDIGGPDPERVEERRRARERQGGLDVGAVHHRQRPGTSSSKTLSPSPATAPANEHPVAPEPASRIALRNVRVPAPESALVRELMLSATITCDRSTVP